jgi:hypothetical protein
MAYGLAEEMQIPHRFNDENKSLGKQFIASL